MHDDHCSAVELADVSECIEQHARVGVYENNVRPSEIHSKEICPNSLNLKPSRDVTIDHTVVIGGKSVQVDIPGLDLPDCVAVKGEVIEVWPRTPAPHVHQLHSGILPGFPFKMQFKV